MTATDEHPDPRPWYDLSPATEQEAQARRDAMDEAILDDERWIRRRQELLDQQRGQQRQH